MKHGWIHLPQNYIREILRLSERENDGDWYSETIFPVCNTTSFELKLNVRTKQHTDYMSIHLQQHSNWDIRTYAFGLQLLNQQNSHSNYF